MNIQQVIICTQQSATSLLVKNCMITIGGQQPRNTNNTKMKSQ